MLGSIQKLDPVFEFLKLLLCCDVALSSKHSELPDLHVDPIYVCRLVSKATGYGVAMEKMAYFFGLATARSVVIIGFSTK